MENPDDKKEDYKTFYMKQKYRQDTYQVMKHMKISASLDKGTPNMERWNTRIKKEMNDWLAIYRRQNVSVGRQSYYSLYSAINTLASHFTSYGPKFPFPNKRRPRFFELCQQVEKCAGSRADLQSSMAMLVIGANTSGSQDFVVSMALVAVALGIWLLERAGYAQLISCVRVLKRLAPELLALSFGLSLASALVYCGQHNGGAEIPKEEGHERVLLLQHFGTFDFEQCYWQGA
ncbi:Photosystem II repair protein PSB27-H1 [Durusdinium trenchii]|uniref:Chloroplastic (Psb27-H1) (Thylakoid lumenal protein PSB27-H1) n=1 Tax=Durusdinium trenchii TaxID=1381693 RepID=A0ABP0L9A8_9DINO